MTTPLIPRRSRLSCFARAVGRDLAGGLKTVGIMGATIGAIFAVSLGLIMGLGWVCRYLGFTVASRVPGQETMATGMGALMIGFVIGLILHLAWCAVRGAIDWVRDRWDESA